MSEQRHSIWTCDRCGHVETSPALNGPASWFSENDWAGLTLTPHKLHSKVDQHKLLCPDCTRQARSFFAGMGASAVSR